MELGASVLSRSFCVSYSLTAFLSSLQVIFTMSLKLVQYHTLVKFQGQDSIPDPLVSECMLFAVYLPVIRKYILGKVFCYKDFMKPPFTFVDVFLMIRCPHIEY